MNVDDWYAILEEYPSEKLRKSKQNNNTQELSKIQKYCAQWKILEVWHYFDVLAWWRRVGKIDYPRIFIAACVILAKPYTNAYLERSFSIRKFYGNII